MSEAGDASTTASGGQLQRTSSGRVRKATPKYTDAAGDDDFQDDAGGDSDGGGSAGYAAPGGGVSVCESEDDDVEDDFSEDEKPKKKAKKAGAAAKASKTKEVKTPAKKSTPKATKASSGKAVASASASASAPSATAARSAGSTAVGGVKKTGAGAAAAPAAPGKRPVSAVSTATPAASGAAAVAKPATEAQAEVVLVDYLTRTNRPYSALNVFDNLHGIIGKTVVPRLLDKLADEGKIVAKVYGKFKLYWASQDKYGDVSQEEIDALTADQKRLEAEATAAASKKRETAAKLSAVSNAMSAEELAAALESTRATVATMRAKLDKFKSGTGTVLVTPAQRAAAKGDLDKYRRMWAARKRMVMELLDNLSEGMNKHPRVIAADIGIETDEEARLNIKDFA